MELRWVVTISMTQGKTTSFAPLSLTGTEYTENWLDFLITTLPWATLVFSAMALVQVLHLSLLSQQPKHFLPKA